LSAAWAEISNPYGELLFVKKLQLREKCFWIGGRDIPYEYSYSARIAAYCLSDELGQ
jgi:hypothetical protein